MGVGFDALATAGGATDRGAPVALSVAVRLLGEAAAIGVRAWPLREASADAALPPS